MDRGIFAGSITVYCHPCDSHVVSLDVCQASPGLLLQTPCGSHGIPGFFHACLIHRKVVVSAAILIIAGTMLIIPHVGSEYIPQSGTGDFSLDIKLKEGTQLDRTEGLVKNLESMLNEILGDKADIIYSQVGPSESSNSEKSVFQNENTASVKIRLKPSAIPQSESTYCRNRSHLADSIPDAEIIPGPQ